MADRITTLTNTRPIVDSTGVTTQEARVFFQLITDRMVIIGHNSPEGVVEASQGAQYMDELGNSGTILYIKKLDDIGGDRSLGWVLV